MTSTTEATRARNAHRITAEATTLGLPIAIIETATGPRIQTTGADGKPAWLDDPLDLQYLTAELTAPPSPHTNAALLPGPAPINRWSRQHDRCIDCNTTRRPHMGFGRCTACYIKSRRRASTPNLERTAA